MDGELKELYTAILEGQRDEAKEYVEAALRAGVPAGEVLDVMVNAMGEVGELFEEGEYFVPEMLIAARAMKTGMEILKPELVGADIQPIGKIVAGTVKGDLHDIGKNLVCMMLEGAGFQVVDLGTDVSPEAFIAAVQEHQPDFVAMSALLTTTMPNMETTITALNAAGLRGAVRVLIGGAPVTQSYADKIGADGYAPDASRAVKLAKTLLG
ncbi:MAG TPA: corrinoid protein [Brevefilum fermentans]|mgnify:FL=1|jgi:5-methyltetrahydrofolate--homocysteine methyltransferase|uniref:Dimethylamine corrinoid protein 3 n=1 Tax=Candidatus Brevifilum fermentans TaxID=1986204 RepID=A0A1Y6K5W7_9CHLR|nr:corrinoid protein [Brevefilum fermentans]MDI9566165.1 corrinoid protein [Chloroflexota bacterium]OQB86053.1 MAG: Methionine synthase [Chloroflexi bacterium ADurb.Bin120]SMX55102.1 Dimethylamine corrinoid protein 3 [Brevefilum fermentans]HOM66662.1 corrinoid protein [Brevefilum fermentans]HPX96184.1 corrinoid protein [Brevefilum fermentans]